MSTSILQNIDWSNTGKQIARKLTIIDPYKYLFGKSIPPERQYWSMCGLNADEKGNLRIGSELDQIIKNGIITPSQFVGVEIDPVICAKNKNIINGALWKEGDFYEKCIEAGDDFFPSIVNLDTTKMPMGSMGYLGQIIRLIEHNNVLVVLNFVKKYRHKSLSYDVFISNLEKEPHMQKCLLNGWKLWSPEQYPMAYKYPAHGGKNNLMASLVMYRKL